LELPMLIPGQNDICSKIQSIATQNSIGASMHPCLTPDVVWNLQLQLATFFNYLHS